MLSIIFLLLGACNSISFPLEKLSKPWLNISYFITTQINGRRAVLGLDLASKYSFVIAQSCNCTENPQQMFGSAIPKDSFEITYKTMTFTVFESEYNVFGQNTSVKLLTVEKSSNFLENFKFHGIIGLGYNSRPEITTFAENFGKEINDESFSLVLNSEYDSNVISLIEFGNVEVKKYFEGKKRKKEIISENEVWELHLSRVSIGEYDINLNIYAHYDVNVDKILVPSKDFEKIMDTLKKIFKDINESSLEFPCGDVNITEVFSMVLTVERTKFPMRNNNIIQVNNNICKVLLEKHSENFWVFGEPFFQDYFVSFSYSSRALTFYQLDKFTPGFYELSIVAFVIISFFMSLCLGWCMTSSNSNKKTD